MSTIGASKGAYATASRPTRRRAFSMSARRCSAGRSAPKRWRPYSVIGCSGVFCTPNNCEDDHSVQVCGVSPSRSAKLLDQPRAADARLATDHKRELALAFAGALPTPTEQIEAPPCRRRAASALFDRTGGQGAARAHDAMIGVPTAAATPLSACAPRSSATKTQPRRSAVVRPQ